jgi:hypothetical protein
MRTGQRYSGAISGRDSLDRLVVRAKHCSCSLKKSYRLLADHNARRHHVAGCVYRKPHPAMISDSTGKIPVPEPEWSAPVVPENFIRADSRHEVESAHHST